MASVAELKSALQRIAEMKSHFAGQTPNEYHMQQIARDALGYEKLLTADFAKLEAAYLASDLEGEALKIFQEHCDNTVAEPEEVVMVDGLTVHPGGFAPGNYVRYRISDCRFPAYDDKVISLRILGPKENGDYWLQLHDRLDKKQASFNLGVPSISMAQDLLKKASEQQ